MYHARDDPLEKVLGLRASASAWVRARGRGWGRGWGRVRGKELTAREGARHARKSPTLTLALALTPNP